MSIMAWDRGSDNSWDRIMKIMDWWIGAEVPAILGLESWIGTEVPAILGLESWIGTEVPAILVLES